MQSYRKNGFQRSYARRRIVAVAAVAALATAGLVTSASTAGTFPITDCNSAINALNKQLPVIAKRKIAVRVAQASTSQAKVKRAKKRYSASRSAANKIRTQVKQRCASGSLNAFNALCTQSIDVYAGSLNLLATRRYEYKKIKGKGARSTKRKRTLKTKIKKLAANVHTQSKTFQTACSGGPGGPGGGAPQPTPPVNNDFKDPVTTVSCTPAQFHHKLGCFAGAPAISIPSFPDGLKSNYQVQISGRADGVCSLSGLQSNYKLMIIVDGDPVATDIGGGFLQTACNPTINLDAQIAALTLSPTRAHHIVLNLNTDVLLPVTPKIDYATMTVDIAQL